MRRTAAALLSASSIILCTAFPARAQLDSGPWPMFHYDERHTGLSPYAGPSAPALGWSYRTGNWVRSSPAIGSDGGIYV
ncbi:unnamed protein product, partial [marine sediment metagenome]